MPVMSHCKILRYLFWSGQMLNPSCSYRTGLRTMIIMVSVGIVFAALQEAIYIIHNRRVAQGKNRGRNGSPPMIYVP